MYRTILVPLDGSGRAEAILPHVEAMARCMGSTVILMEVIEPIPVILDAHESVIALEMVEVKRLEEEAQTYLAARQGDLRARGISAETCILHGPVAEAIIHAANTEDADLIAMASHGRGGLARVVYGSVAAAVLQRIDRPLLLIRAREEV